MSLASTERFDARYDDLDLSATDDIVSNILATQQAALQGLRPALPALSRAIEALAGVLRAGGRMAYAGAGSSGLIAQLDALELPGTFGIEPDRVPVILAGGPDGLASIPSGVEDDTQAGEAAVDALALGPGDGLIAVAASGSTPFTVAALARARRRGAVTVGLACAAWSPLLAACDHPILIATPPEVIAGSTRMGAGTAQKCALNILSTGVAVRLGHAYRGLMVNMRPDNAKLRARAAGIVAQAAGVDAARAERALVEAGWSIKTSIVACLASVDAGAARARLEAGGGDIRAALSQGSAA